MKAITHLRLFVLPKASVLINVARILNILILRAVIDVAKLESESF